MHKFRILVVDDDNAILDVLRKVFTEAQGFECETVNTLRSARARCRENGIDVVILDLGLHDALGFEGLEKMLEEFPRLPIVVFTGHHDETDAFRALQMGAQAYLKKPPDDIKVLYEAVSTAIARQHNVNRLRDEIEGMRQGFNWKVWLGWIGTAILGVFEFIKGMIELGK